MIADTTGRVHRSRSGSSLATALRDRSSLIPVQPNRSLPIRPLPAPVRVLRGTRSPGLRVSRSSNLEPEPRSPVGGAQDEPGRRQLRRRQSEEKEPEKPARKRKRSREPEQCTIKDSGVTLDRVQTRKQDTQKQEEAVDGRKEKVPPLRLKKVMRTGMSPGSPDPPDQNGASNYRIVTGSTPARMIGSKRKMMNSTKRGCDGQKLKCRRDRLRRKLGELRVKAVELTDKMADPIGCREPEEVSRLRQAMNRYEKQIENLSKLLHKLSAVIPERDAVEVDKESVERTPEERVHGPEEVKEPAVSPEPPKLSPNPQNHEEDSCKSPGSPPILPRAYFHEQPEEVDRKPATKEEKGFHLTELQVPDTMDLDQGQGPSEAKVHAEMEFEESKEPVDRKPPKDQPTENPDGFKVTDGQGQEVEGQAVATSGGPTITNILQLQSNYFGPTITKDNILFGGGGDNPTNVQKVGPGSNQSVILNCTTAPFAFTEVGSTTSGQQAATASTTNKPETAQNNVATRTDGRLVAEQFPTLGNWVARMSKKHSPKSKSKQQTQTEEPNHQQQEPQKVPVNNVNNNPRGNLVNVSLQWNMDRWQKQQQQQQQQQQQRQQQLLHQMNSQQLRPGLCPPIPMAQFYPNGYTLDPFTGAPVACHSATCPYGPYPYHPRIPVCPPIPGYHLSIQDGPLRTLHHPRKRLGQPPIQEQIRHYQGDLIRLHAYQHQAPVAVAVPVPVPAPAAGSTATSGPGLGSTANPAPAAAPGPAPGLASASAPAPPQALPPASGQTSAPGPAPPLVQPEMRPSVTVPPILLPPPPGSAQILPRTPQFTSNGGQFARSRMIPDMVAAAAAAAVVAAASFGGQQPITSYGRVEPEPEPSTTGTAQALDPPSNPSQSKARHCQSNSQYQAEPSHVTELQNILLDQLSFARASDGFAHTSSSETTAATTVTTTTATTTTRNCETPHLGKVNHSSSLNSITCSNCGLTGSMFKCLGCEMAFYCDERCQTRHWTVHVEKCPKKMPRLKKVM